MNNDLMGNGKFETSGWMRLMVLNTLYNYQFDICEDHVKPQDWKGCWFKFIKANNINDIDLIRYDKNGMLIQIFPRITFKTEVKYDGKDKIYLRYYFYHYDGAVHFMEFVFSWNPNGQHREKVEFIFATFDVGEAPKIHSHTHSNYKFHPHTGGGGRGDSELNVSPHEHSHSGNKLHPHPGGGGRTS